MSPIPANRPTPADNPPEAPILVWFRNDLRLSDNPAFTAAMESGRPVVPVFILDDDDAGSWAPGGASRWWLHGSLTALSGALQRRSLSLVLRRGRADAVIRSLADESGAAGVYWNRRYEPWAMARDRDLKAGLSENGIDAKSFNAALLFEPWTLTNKSGGWFKVYTPFWRAVWAARDRIGDPMPAPKGQSGTSDFSPASDRLDDWGLLPTTPDWAHGLRDRWQPGEVAAQERLAEFLDHAVERYKSDRDLPAQPATSRLSPHLRWGEIGPRQIWAATLHRLGGVIGSESDEVVHFLKEVVWREFSYHLLYHVPTLPEAPLNPAFGAFPWASDTHGGHLRRWQKGQTGYPIVDAGMRELWTTGWMHNRVRMIAASFLIKHLLIPWQQGEAWFWDTLVDADLASNSASWQWVAGCGADAAPYFRIFNPVLQGEKFDPDGAYVRRWVPEIAGLPDRFVHKPWEAPEQVLTAAGVQLGTSYPEPVVDHRAARNRALAAFETIKSRKAA